MASYTYHDGHWQQYTTSTKLYRNYKQNAESAQVFLIVEPPSPALHRYVCSGRRAHFPKEEIQHAQISPQGQITLVPISRGQALKLTQGTWHT